ncbi:hypothetical protein PTTG_28409 [Puccinia triticina 1-1 BBBD Race 1]|uniref:Uncharacterized protein n=1 Tax=Puccinia triticina (isolate 1-1 / race 1 (BBBD)) TaxID=630390 RepID=A0A180GBU7_PUCT1|nr:hypothetical protein PTTG_28409 [Puccinia triticina 1-1 BBBD Race 1]
MPRVLAILAGLSILLQVTLGSPTPIPAGQEEPAPRRIRCGVPGEGAPSPPGGGTPTERPCNCCRNGYCCDGR